MARGFNFVPLAGLEPAAKGLGNLCSSYTELQGLKLNCAIYASAGKKSSKSFQHDSDRAMIRPQDLR